MGGDGGVVATNRRYMRGAGFADHTADAKRVSATAQAVAEREGVLQKIRACNISGSVFDLSVYYNDGGSGRKVGSLVSDIVSCPLGFLYKREVAIESLLRRKGCDTSSESVDIGWHVRGLKDLFPVRFHVSKRHQSDPTQCSNDKHDDKHDEYIPTCPLTGVEINGIQAAYVVVKMDRKGKNKNNENTTSNMRPNVISERAMKEIGVDSLQEEYGPFKKDDLIRLTPPPGRVFNEIKEKLELRRRKESKDKGTTQKRKRSNKKTIVNTTTKKGKISPKVYEKCGNSDNSTSSQDLRKMNVDDTPSSHVYESLFVSDKKAVSEKKT